MVVPARGRPDLSKLNRMRPFTPGVPDGDGNAVVDVEFLEDSLRRERESPRATSFETCGDCAPRGYGAPDSLERR